MNGEARRSVKSFLIELVVYGALVLAYFFLVLKLLGGWLQSIYHDDRRLYAAVALGLIVCQGIVLEIITTALLSVVKRWLEDE
jgi:hypothetical protein